MTYKTLSDVPEALQNQIKAADGDYATYESGEYPQEVSQEEFNRALDLMRGFPDEWPDGVEYWAQDGDSMWWAFPSKPKIEGDRWMEAVRNHRNGTLIGDWRKTLRKRPNNESKWSETMENKPNEPKWLENPMTGECPVPAGDDVEVMIINGSTGRNKAPKHWYWGDAYEDCTVTHYRNWTQWEREQGEVQGGVSVKQDLAAATLQAALGHMQDRATTCDSERGERSMGKCVTMFNTLYEQELTEEQGWAFVCLLKLVRTSQGDFRADNYEDLAAYAGLMRESADK